MRKLRWRLVGIVFSSVVAVFAIMNLVLIFCLRTYNNDQADQMTQIISENDGTVPLMKDYDEKSVKKQLFLENLRRPLRAVPDLVYDILIEFRFMADQKDTAAVFF